MVRLCALGDCAIEIGARRLGPDAERAFAVLLVLVLAGRRPVPRRWLLDLIWPNVPDDQRRHNLRQTFYKLRQYGVLLRSDRSSVQLAEPRVELDLDSALATEEMGAAAMLGSGAAFGEFLAGFNPRFSEPFAAWLDEQRDLAHGRLRRALLALLLDSRRRGAWDEVEALSRRVLVVDPLNEEGTLALAEAVALSGSKSAALGILDRYTTELGEGAGEIKLPALVLRRRIAERLHVVPSLAAGEACFVGRDETMALLNQQLQSAKSRQGQGCLVHGDAGMGKTRSLSEFSRIAVLEGARVQVVGCQPRDVERPLSVFVDIVPSLLALPGALGCSPSSLGYLRRLVEHDPTMETPSPDTREGELLFSNVRGSLFDLFDAVAEEACVVLAFEDVHWLDSMSWEILRELIGWCASRRILVLLTSRTPFATPQPPRYDAERMIVHRLTPLDHGAAVRLLAAVLGSDASAMSTGFRDWCIHLAEGNPFFLRALAVNWMETGEMRVPTSLQVLIDSRVSRIAPSALRTLQACAVLGRNSTFERLERVLQHRHFELLESVSELEGQGLLAPDGPRVPAKHELVAGAALQRLSDAARRLLHRLAGMVLQEDIEKSKPAGLLWDCAEHWQTAGERDHALTLVRSCAIHLIELGISTDAIEILERALLLCINNEESLAVNTELAAALRLSGRWQQLANVLATIRSIQLELRPNDDVHDDIELSLLESKLRSDFDFPTLLVHAETCTNNINATAEHRLRAATSALMLADNLYDSAAAKRIYDTARNLSRARIVDARASLRCDLVFHAVYGVIEESVAAGERLVLLEREANSPATLSRALRHLSIPLRHAGDVPAAVSHAVDAYQLAARFRLASEAFNAADTLTTLNLHLGDLTSCRLWYTRASEWLNHAEEGIGAKSLARVGARMALLELQPAAARLLVPGLASEARTDSILRRRLESKALLILLGWYESRTVFDADLTEFQDLYALGCTCGGQDFATAALLVSMSASDRLADAHLLLAQYLGTTRRERGPVSAELRSVIETLNL